MKASFVVAILLFLTFSLKAQTVEYQIGKYKATIDLTNLKMKWEKGQGYTKLKELNEGDKNTRVFQEIDNGKVIGRIEIYNITDGEHDGLYLRIKDQMELSMSALRVIKP